MTTAENHRHARDVLDALPRGERHFASKLTDKQVRTIYQKACAGTKRRTLASEYGISRGVISGITSGKSWKHLGLRPRRFKRYSRLTPPILKAIARAFAAGAETVEVGRRFGVSQSYAHNLKSGKRRPVGSW